MKKSTLTAINKIILWNTAVHLTDNEPLASWGFCLKKARIFLLGKNLVDVVK